MEAEPLAFKYYGYCSRNTALRAELQVAPMLIGLFWEVEHSAIYKPSPRFKGVLAGMDERTIKVYEALKDFEFEFERLIRRDPLNVSEDYWQNPVPPVQATPLWPQPRAFDRDEVATLERRKKKKKKGKERVR